MCRLNVGQRWLYRAILGTQPMAKLMVKVAVAIGERKSRLVFTHAENVVKSCHAGQQS